ncbi:hypothetical protein Emed_005054 [Eimeria media]
MGWPSCSHAVGRLLQGLLSGFRCCARQLQHLLQLLLHMKAAKLIRQSGRSWNWLWGNGRAPQYQLRVLLVGKRFTGKTTLLYRLKLGAFIPTKPSVGSNTELVVLNLGPHTESEEAREEPLDVESAPPRPSTSSLRVAFCDVAGGDGESLEWQGLQRDLHNARSTADIKGILELPEEVKETALSGAGLAQVQQWLASVAISLSRANSFWRSACPRNFRRGGARAAAATSEGSTSSDRQQELLGTCATEASSFIQPLAEHQLKADGGDEALRQALQTTVLL